jgi:hypothetical protein
MKRKSFKASVVSVSVCSNCNGPLLESGRESKCPICKAFLPKAKSFLWKNPAIPENILAKKDFMDDFMTQLDVQRSTDSPSSSDLMSIFDKYNRSTPVERDAIDAAFVWFSGYSLASLAAMAVSKDPSKYYKVITKWQKLEKKS